MQQTNDSATFLRNNEQTDRDEDLIADSNHGFADIRENDRKSENAERTLEGSNDVKTITTRKWQITLTSADCTIEEHCQGWQVRKRWFKKTNKICAIRFKKKKKKKLLFREIFCKIYSKDRKEIGEESKIILRVTDSTMIANAEPARTANVKILCNRDDLNDLLEEEEKENVNTHGKIILREYLRLLSTEEAKINFILKVLTKAVNEHKVFAIYGVFPPLRKPLGKRGWIEKRFIRRMLAMSPEILEGCSQKIHSIRRESETYTDSLYFSRPGNDREVIALSCQFFVVHQ